MGTVEDFLGSKLGLRSSRAASNLGLEDQDEREQLLQNATFEKENRKETKKSQGRPWKAKQEDYPDDVFGNHRTGNGNVIPLQRAKVTTQLQGSYQSNMLFNQIKSIL